MFEILSETSMKLYTGETTWTLPYTKAEMPATIEKGVSEAELREKRLIMIDDLSWLNKEKPSFDLVQCAFLRLTNIGMNSTFWDSPIWKEQKDFTDLKQNYSNFLIFYSHWAFYDLTRYLADGDTFEIQLMQSTCFGSIDISGTNTEEEVKLSCGSFKFAKPDDTYTANIAGYYERARKENEETSFNLSLLKTKFHTLKEEQENNKTFEAKKQKSYWFMPFLMSKTSPSGYEGFACFKGTVNTAGLTISTESSVQQFQAPISVEGTPVRILRDYDLKGRFILDSNAPDEPASPPASSSSANTSDEETP